MLFVPSKEEFREFVVVDGIGVGGISNPKIAIFLYLSPIESLYL